MDPDSASTTNQTQAPPPAQALTLLQAQGRVLADHARLLQEASTAVQSLNNRLQAQEVDQQQRGTQIESLIAMTQALTTQVAALVASTPPPPSVDVQHPAPPSGQPPVAQSVFQPTTPPNSTVVVEFREPKLANPRPFDGTFSQFRGFLMQCELMFAHQPNHFQSPAARVAFITNLTTGDALNWAQAILTARPELLTDYPAFLVELKRVFDHPTAGQDVGARLMSIHQGTRTAAAYSTEFRTLAAESGWNEAGLKSAFRQGLNETIKDELVRDKPATLDELVALAIDIDERSRERRREKTRHQTSSPRLHESTPGSSTPKLSPSSTAESTTLLPGEEPMQLGRARLTAAEKQRRRTQGLCLYCGEKGHVRDACPVLPKE